MTNRSVTIFIIHMIALVLFLGFVFVERIEADDLTYPDTRKGDTADIYHGVSVPDPYRWLEDTDSPETRSWIEAQNRITFEFLEQIPERKRIKERLLELSSYEKYDIPKKYGNRYFFEKKDGLQNQYVIYTMKSLDDEPKVLLDPNTLSDDGTVALTDWSITSDGNLMAYGLSTSGNDWREWFVRDVKTGNDLPDHLKWVKFSDISWTIDGKGFYYSRYDEPDESAMLQDTNYFHKLYYHQIGTPQSADKLIYHQPDKKEWGFGGKVTDDGKYLIIHVWQGTHRENLVFYQDLDVEDKEIVELIDEFTSQFTFIDNMGSMLWFRTDSDAPHGKVIGIDIASPEPENWLTIIPEASETLEDVTVVGDRFFAAYIKDAYTRISMYDHKGSFIDDLPLPGIGTAYGFYGDRQKTETFYRFTSFTDPGTIFRYDLTTGANEIFRRPEVDFNPEDYQTVQIFYSSKDGTRVPMFITHRRDVERNGNNPTILYGYGGFNYALTPYFRAHRIVWMDMEGIYAFANIRGGGEYGKAWHEAGMKLKKQNTFDDFIAAGEWLIDNRYTSTPKLAITGASNGGTTVGACMNQRPDLFGACLPAVGVMDMLRFHKFTIGWAWVSDYGSPEDPEDFKVLHSYSPLHNIKPGTSYPATLVTTADHDDRVVPGHSFKYIAALQESHAGQAPVLIRIQTKAGHGGGKPTLMRIEEETDTYAFLVRVLDMRLW